MMEDKLELYHMYIDELVESNVDRLRQDVEILIKLHGEGDMDGVIKQLSSLVTGATNTIGLVTPSIVLNDIKSIKGGQENDEA